MRHGVLSIKIQQIYKPQETDGHPRLCVVHAPPQPDASAYAEEVAYNNLLRFPSKQPLLRLHKLA